MRRFAPWTGGALFGIGVALAATAIAKPKTFSTDPGVDYARAPIQTAGAPTKLAATTSVNADSGALSINTVYLIECDSDAWMRTGTSAADAVADDRKLRADRDYYFTTDTTLLHVSVLSVSADGDCRLTEMQ